MKGVPSAASLNYRKGFGVHLKKQPGHLLHIRKHKNKHILELQSFQATAAVGC